MGKSTWGLAMTPYEPKPGCYCNWAGIVAGLSVRNFGGSEVTLADTTKPCQSGLFSALLKGITEPGKQAVAIFLFPRSRTQKLETEPHLTH